MNTTLFTFKNFILMILFLCMLLSLRWSWTVIFPSSEQPHPVDGVLDIRGWDFGHSPPISLDGEWEFFPSKLYSYTDTSKMEDDSFTFVQVPGDWQNAFPKEPETSFGYGTYRLRILVDPLEQPVSLWLKKVQSASIVEINGYSEGEIGKPAANPKDYIPKKASYTSTYSEKGVQELVVLIQVANYEDPYNGGILHSIRFGSQASIDKEHWYSIGFQLITFVVLLLHGFYAFIMYLFNRQERSLLIFCLLALLAGITVVSDHENLLMLWLPINYAWLIKIRMLSYLWLAFFILYFFRRFTSIKQARIGFFIYSAILVSYSIFLFSAQTPLIHATFQFRIFSFMYLFPLAWVIYLIVKIYFTTKTDEDAVFLLLSAAAMLSSAIWGALSSYITFPVVYYPIDIIAAIIGFSTYWFKKYFRKSHENVRLNRQLQETDRLKDQFLAHTSHELRTPLHGIINIAETVLNQEKERLNQRSLKNMELLVTISRRMSHMLADLLDVAQLREHRIVLQKEPLLIQSILPSVVSMLHFLYESKPIHLKVDVEPSFPAVMADEKRLVQILYNLLHNAIKYTERGTVTVSVEMTVGHALIRVIDTGVGMDEETIAKAFIPYEQGPHGINEGSGIGLGLSICKQLIELHNGSLTIQSEPGKGSVVSFNLSLADSSSSSLSMLRQPRVRPEAETTKLAAVGWVDNGSASGLAAASIESYPSLLGNDNVKILAVDDDPINLKVLVSILSTESHMIKTVSSGEEALRILDEQQWDLMIIDVMMPHMSGYELTRKVREYYSLSELPILLLTARTQTADIYTGFSSGANDYVTKPVDALELKYRISALTGLKQSLHESLRMEAAYLQAQIQPHFLFNALNSILSLSVVDIERMHKLTEAFTEFLRISFNFFNTQHIVDLSHELELVKAYLYIEKERFEDRLTVTWEVDPYLELQLPPLSIQPLVENAVKHGLLSRRQGGTVHIRVIRQDHSALIEVKDDGIGMDQGTVDQLLARSDKRRQGIGLYNTNRRLKKHYGHGLIIQSKPGEGTAVSFIIPLTKINLL